MMDLLLPVNILQPDIRDYLTLKGVLAYLKVNIFYKIIINTF